MMSYNYEDNERYTGSRYPCSVPSLSRSPLKAMLHPHENKYLDTDLVNGDAHTSNTNEHLSFFWRAHTISVLIVVITVLSYVALVEDVINDPVYNTKRGLVACASVFIAFGITQAKDGPFTRPHPVFWRLVLCCSIIYELVLIFLLFQTPSDAQKLMGYIDPSLGKPLPEKNYGGNCLIYDADNASNPFHNVWEKCDSFVAGHLIGWWVKTLLIRDYYFTNILSVLFELYEYSLEHQLPNFSECWWDHWVMDALICNGLGIFFGMKTLQHLAMKEYNWIDLWSIPTYSGKLKRVAAQFTPYSWHQFHWNATESLRRWLAFIGIMFMFSITELNTFYLKFVLSIPPTHILVLVRLVLLCSMASVALKEAYEYIFSSRCRKLGQQAWMVSAVVVTETLISLRFGWETVILPPPKHVIIFWSITLSTLIVYTIAKFVPKIWIGRQNMLKEKKKC